ncbi:MAG: family 20 glycosylhydrolase, partial [Bacilli bacterium]
VVQHWKYFTRKKTVKEINRGRRAVLSDYFYLYLDLPYALTPLKKTYQFEPLGKKIKNTANVLGIEAPLWTEWVPDRSKIDFQIFPRLAAVAEIAWTEKENKSYDDFIERLKNLYSHYRKMNVGFAEDKENQPNLFARAWGALSWFQDEDCELRKKKRRR